MDTFLLWLILALTIFNAVALWKFREVLDIWLLRMENLLKTGKKYDLPENEKADKDKEGRDPYAHL